MTKSRRGAGAGAGGHCGRAKILAKPTRRRKHPSKTAPTLRNAKRQTRPTTRLLRRSNAPSPCETNSLFLPGLKEGLDVNTATVDPDLNDPDDVGEGTILPSIEHETISEPAVKSSTDSLPSDRPCRLRLYLRRPCRLRLFMKDGYHADDDRSGSEFWEPSSDNGSPSEERNMQPVISMEYSPLFTCRDGLSTEVYADESGYESGDPDHHDKTKQTTTELEHFEREIQGTLATSRHNNHRAQAKYDANGNRPAGSLLSQREKKQLMTIGQFADGGGNLIRSFKDSLWCSDEWSSFDLMCSSDSTSGCDESMRKKDI